MSSVEIALSIPGFHTEDELYTLAALCRHAQTIVEIGVWKGRSSALLAAESGGVVHAIDDWRGQASNKDAEVNKELAEVGVDAVRLECEQHLAPWISTGQIHLYNSGSIEAAPVIAATVGMCVDFIYIDGNHTYDGCKTDIQLFKPLLRKGGTIAGHNYTSKGVHQAVNELLGPIHVDGRIWWSR
jgi:predicted O-methyltransferase YrrM